MPENPNPPASGELPPERPADPVEPVDPADPPPPAEETVTMPQEPAAPAAAPTGPTRFRRAASHRATPIVAAALAGVLVGGGVMALIAYTGDGRDRDDRPARAEMFRDGPRGGGFGGFGERGPMMRQDLRGELEPWRQDLRDRFQQRFEQLPVPPHQHDEDGNVIPAPRDGEQPEAPAPAPEQEQEQGGN